MARIVNGKRRGRPGRWLVDWSDALGKRRLTTCYSREAAEHVLERARREGTMRRNSGLDPTLTVHGLVDVWRDLRYPLVRPQTRTTYDGHLNGHFLPAFGTQRVTALTPLLLERWAAQLRANHKGSTVCSIVATARNVLAVAVRHGLLTDNPARGISRAIGLRAHDPSAMRALTAPQLQGLLAAARAQDTDLYERLAYLADTGTRVSEAFGAQWDDVDFDGPRLSIVRQVGRAQGVQEILKTSSSRAEIDLPACLAELLRVRRARLRAEAFAAGRQLSPWILWPEWGTGEPSPAQAKTAYYRLYRQLRGALKAAGLPVSFSLHSLRHTYVSRHLAAGISPAYVQRQARHSSQATTVDLYGSWLPHRRPEELDRLGVSRTSSGTF